MTIRYTTASDLDSIHSLIVQLEEHEMEKEKFSDVFLRNLGSHGIFYFTGELDGKVMGFISLHIQRLLHHNGEVAEIQELCVDEQYRGKGYGKVLLDYAVSVAQNSGCELIELCANRKRKQAHRFYEREGWNRSHYKFTRDLK